MDWIWFGHLLSGGLQAGPFMEGLWVPLNPSVRQLVLLLPFVEGQLLRLIEVVYFAQGHPALGQDSNPYSSGSEDCKGLEGPPCPLFLLWAGVVAEGP